MTRPARAGRVSVGLVTVLALSLSWGSASALDHGLWEDVLQRHVDAEGRVAYARLARDDRATLERYISTLATADPTAMASDDAKAFWVNAYNAAVFAAVIDGYSAESFLGRRSIFKRFMVEVAGKKRTLDEIEHEIIRPRFHDPRTHFALVCASSSCPRLRQHAYTGATIERALDEEARRFINDSTRNRIDPSSRRVELSTIFRWFEEDFVSAAGSVESFVARYVEGDSMRDLLLGKTGALSYLPYDWTMNAQVGQRP